MSAVKRFSTIDPEQARENVRVCHPWIRGYEPLAGGDRFRHSRIQIALDSIMISRSLFSHVRMTAENEDRLIVVLAERGWRSLQGRGEAAVSADGASAVLMPRGRVIYENRPESSGFVVSIPVGDLAKPVQLALGRYDTQARRIELMSHAASRFRAPLHFIFSQLSDPRASCTPKLTAAFREVLLGGLAALITPSAGAIVERDAGAELVHRACELMRESAGKPLCLSDFARLLRVSLRHLQANFRNHLGTTPQKFLRDCRIDMAHRMLSFPSRGDTAATIAQACGFGHMGEFAGHYRELYVECPSDTLSRWRAQFH